MGIEERLKNELGGLYREWHAKEVATLIEKNGSDEEKAVRSVVKKVKRLKAGRS